MHHAMEELLNVIAGVDEEEYLLVKIAEAAWVGASLELKVEISVEDRAERGAWSIRCEYLLAHTLSGQSGSSLELVDDHPLLWEFKYPNASAFFDGVPSNSEACIGALYKAHEGATSSWLRLGAYLNNSGHLSELLSAGNGLLARGPVPLLQIYKDALQPHGVDVSIVGEHHPKFFDGMTRRSTDGEDIKALLLGASYVVGIGWTAERTRD